MLLIFRNEDPSKALRGDHPDMDCLFPWWAAEGSVVGYWRPALESHLTMWAMSQLVSEDRGLMISTPSSVTMAISYWNGTTKNKKAVMWRQGHGACGMGHVAALTHSVVGASISVVQHFEAALDQISSLLLGEFWLVFHCLPHQRLQNTEISSTSSLHVLHQVSCLNKCLSSL